MSLLARSDALHAEVRAFAAGRSARSFAELARAIAELQAEFSAGFARLVRAAGGSLDRVERIPGVPSETFRRARVALHAPEHDVVRFLTSGTSGDERGTHALRTTQTYRELALAYGAQALLAGEARPRVVALAPHPGEPPSSSLGFMMQLFMTSFDRAGAGADVSSRFLIDASGLRLTALEQAARAALDADEPLLVLATSFALVELLDALGSRTLRAPERTTVMQTGGFKGKTREIPAEELRGAVARAFGIPPARVVSEYGMTELSSQMYEATLPGSALHARHGGEPGRLYEPAWLRVVPVDPTTLEPVADGEVGIARVVDLANVDSALCIQTRDLVRRHAQGFELLGRAPGATPRGCSLAIEEFMAAAREARAPVSVALAHGAESRAPSAGTPRPAVASQPARRARIERLLASAREIADAGHARGQAARRALLPGSHLSPQGLDFALENCLEHTPSEAELRALIDASTECPRAHVLLSAGVCTAALRAIALALAASERVLVRASRRDPEMPRLLLEGAPAAFALVEELTPEAGDHVWAYGRDQTLSQVEARLAPGVVLHRHGAGFGLAVLDESAEPELEALAAGLARDVALFDQRGCLSPRVLLVQGPSRLAERATDALIAALDALEQRVPLGALDASELAEVAEYRDSARYAGRLEPAGRGFVSLGAEDRWLLPPVGRNLHVLPTRNALPLLERASRHVTSVALRGRSQLELAVRGALPGARVGAFGHMQSPPFDGPVDRRLG